VSGTLGKIQQAAPLAAGGLMAILAWLDLVQNWDQPYHETTLTKMTGSMAAWDKMQAAVAKNPALALTGPGAIAGIARLFGGPTETEILEREQTSASTAKWNQLKFEQWWASQARATGQYLPAGYWQAMGGGAIPVNLGQGQQMMSYEQTLQAFLGRYAQVSPQTGRVEATFTIYDRTSGGVEISGLDVGSYAPSNR